MKSKMAMGEKIKSKKSNVLWPKKPLYFVKNKRKCRKIEILIFAKKVIRKQPAFPRVNSIGYRSFRIDKFPLYIRNLEFLKGTTPNLL